MDTWCLHVLHSKTLECGNKQSAKDKLDDDLVSLNAISKLHSRGFSNREGDA